MASRRSAWGLAAFMASVASVASVACKPGEVRRAAPPPSAPAAEVAPAPMPGSGASTEIAFWLMSEDTWRSTLYWLADGEIREGDTVATAGTSDAEAVGPLRWLTGCPGACSVRIRCPLRGTIAASALPSNSCAPLDVVVESRCSDDVVRPIQLLLDGRCGQDDGPRASVVVVGEPVQDGAIAGWAPLVGARYVPCASLAACRSDLAALGPGDQVAAR